MKKVKLLIRKPVVGSENGIDQIEFKPGQIVEVGEVLAKNLIEGPGRWAELYDEGADTAQAEVDTAEPEKVTHAGNAAEVYGAKVDAPDHVKDGKSGGKPRPGKAKAE